MDQSTRVVRLINVSIVLALCAAAAFSSQDPTELAASTRERIKQARDSIVTVKTVDQSNQIVSQALGFFVRKDLVATDIEIDRNSPLHATVATKAGMIKVLSAGHYILPYVLVETQAEVSPLSLGDSERVALKDSVYMLSDTGEIAAGTV